MSCLTKEARNIAPCSSKRPNRCGQATVEQPPRISDSYGKIQIKNRKECSMQNAEKQIYRLLRCDDHNRKKKKKKTAWTSKTRPHRNSRISTNFSPSPSPRALATGPRHGPSPRALATGPRHGPSPRALATGPRHGPSPRALATGLRHGLRFPSWLLRSRVSSAIPLAASSTSAGARPVALNASFCHLAPLLYLAF